MTTSKKISPLNKKALSALLADIHNLIDEWELNIDEQEALLGKKTINAILTYEQDCTPPRFSQMVADRLAIITNIRDDIHVLYPEPNCQNYIRSSNKYFEGLSPLELMLNDQENGATRVQAYLKGTILGSYG